MSLLKNQVVFDRAILAAISRLQGKKTTQIYLGGVTGISVRVHLSKLISAYLEIKNKYFFIGHYYSEELDTYPGLTLPMARNNPVNYFDLLHISNSAHRLSWDKLSKLHAENGKRNPLTIELLEKTLNQRTYSEPEPVKQTEAPKQPKPITRPKPPDDSFDDEEFELERQLIALDRKEIELKLARLRKKKQS